MEPSLFIASIWKKTPKQLRITFLSAWIWGIIAHIYVFTNTVHNYDNISCVPRGVGTGITSGRWMLEIYDKFRNVGGSYNLPVFNGLLTLFFLILAACFVVDLFKIKDWFSCVLIGGIMVCFPTVTSTMLFMFTAPYYGWAILISVFAVWVTARWKFGFLFAVICIACALGTYQAYLPITASLFLVLLIFKLIEENIKWYKGIAEGLKYVGIMLLGVILYYIILNVLLKYWNTNLSDYQGISDMGNFKIKEIPSLICETYANYLGLIKKDYLFIGNNIIIRGCITCLYLCAAVLGGMLIFKTERRIQEKIVIVFLCFLIPIAADSIEIMCPDSYIYTLMIYAMVVIYLIPIIFSELLSKSKKHVRINKMGKWVVSVCVLIVLGGYIYSSNGAYMLMDYTEKQTENYLNILVGRIKSTSGYKDEMSIAFVGDYIEDESFKNPWENSPFRVGGTATTLINRYSRDHFMRNLLGFVYTKASEEEMGKLEENPRVLNMPAYPDDGSIQIVEDIVVVRLNDEAE